MCWPNSQLLYRYLSGCQKLKRVWGQASGEMARKWISLNSSEANSSHMLFLLNSQIQSNRASEQHTSAYSIRTAGVLDGSFHSNAYELLTTFIQHKVCNTVWNTTRALSTTHNPTYCNLKFYFSWQFSETFFICFSKWHRLLQDGHRKWQLYIL